MANDQENPFVVDISHPESSISPHPPIFLVPSQQQQQPQQEFFPSSFELPQQQRQQLPQQSPRPFFPSVLSAEPTNPFSMQTGQTPETEPPLLEELEISIPHIVAKTRAVLNPFHEIPPNLMDDSDLAGPLFYCLLFGIVLLLTGKMQFGYVFGLGAISCVSMWALLSLMSERGASFSCVCSVLGYCLLPNVILAFSGIFFSRILIVRAIFAALTVAWSTYSSSLMLVRALQMVDQRILVAYPSAMIFICFALLTLF